MKRTNCWRPAGHVWFQKNDDSKYPGPDPNRPTGKRFLVVDESNRIQSPPRGYQTTEDAEAMRASMVRERSRRGQKSLNREFGRSKNLRVEAVNFED